MTNERYLPLRSTGLSVRSGPSHPIGDLLCLAWEVMGAGLLIVSMAEAAQWPRGVSVEEE